VKPTDGQEYEFIALVLWYSILRNKHIEVSDYKKNQLRIVSPRDLETHIVSFASEEEKSEWLTHIQTAWEDWKQKQASLIEEEKEQRAQAQKTKCTIDDIPSLLKTYSPSQIQFSFLTMASVASTSEKLFTVRFQDFKISNFKFQNPMKFVFSIHETHIFLILISSSGVHY
jgi:Fe-S cluster biosynthesis and repair protein YggX